MSFLKKNCTIVVLVAIIISSFSLSVFANCERYFGVDLTLVDIEDLILRGAAPLTEEAILDTRSSDYWHRDYVAMGCYVCDGWRDDYSDGMPALDPKSARVGKTFPSSCWNHDNAEEHCAAYYDVVIEN